MFRAQIDGIDNVRYCLSMFCIFEVASIAHLTFYTVFCNGIRSYNYYRRDSYARSKLSQNKKKREEAELQRDNNQPYNVDHLLLGVERNGRGGGRRPNNQPKSHHAKSRSGGNNDHVYFSASTHALSFQMIVTTPPAQRRMGASTAIAIAMKNRGWTGAAAVQVAAAMKNRGWKTTLHLLLRVQRKHWRCFVVAIFELFVCPVVKCLIAM